MPPARGKQSTLLAVASVVAYCVLESVRFAAQLELHHLDLASTRDSEKHPYPSSPSFSSSSWDEAVFNRSSASAGILSARHTDCPRTTGKNDDAPDDGSSHYFAGQWALNVSSAPSRLASSNEETVFDLLVVVPGMGDPNRIPTTLRSLEALRSSLLRSGRSRHHGFGCVVYAYQFSSWPTVEDQLSHLCQVEYSEGLWTHHMIRVPPLQPLRSSANRTYTHVAILMDDVDASEVDADDILQLLHGSNFDGVSPAIRGGQYDCLERRCECLYHRTDFVDMLFAVLRRSTWECWQDHLDPVRNPYGWGMDVTLRHKCNATLGVIDAYEAHHRRHRPGNRLYPENDAREQMRRWIANATGWTAPEEAQEYAECATRKRPHAFPRCQVFWDGTEDQLSNAAGVHWECLDRRIPASADTFQPWTEDDSVFDLAEE